MTPRVEAYCPNLCMFRSSACLRVRAARCAQRPCILWSDWSPTNKFTTTPASAVLTATPSWGEVILKKTTSSLMFVIIRLMFLRLSCCVVSQTTLLYTAMSTASHTSTSSSRLKEITTKGLDTGPTRSCGTPEERTQRTKTPRRILGKTPAVPQWRSLLWLKWTSSLPHWRHGLRRHQRGWRNRWKPDGWRSHGLQEQTARMLRLKAVCWLKRPRCVRAAQSGHQRATQAHSIVKKQSFLTSAGAPRLKSAAGPFQSAALPQLSIKQIWYRHGPLSPGQWKRRK